MPNFFKQLFDRWVIQQATRLAQSSARKYAPMVVISGDYVSLRAMLEGHFEVRELAALADQIFPTINKKICIDIGANIGNHSVFFSRHFDRVIAIEPSSKAFDVLQLNAKWYRNVEPIKIGASDRKARFAARIPDGNLGGGRIDLTGQAGEATVEFECDRLDQVLDASLHDQVGFIKVDVEGHEYPALLGCEGIIRAARPTIAFEMLRSDVDTKLPAIRKWLGGLGYGSYLTLSRGRFEVVKDFKRKNYKMILAKFGPA